MFGTDIEKCFNIVWIMWNVKSDFKIIKLYLHRKKKKKLSLEYTMFIIKLLLCPFENKNVVNSKNIYKKF